MDQAPHLRSQVYLLCRPIFSGQNAQVRRAKKIKEIVQQRKASLQPLLKKISVDKLVKILKELLEDGIFQSEALARQEFPWLFRTSPSRDAQREESEASASRSTAGVLEQIESRGSGAQSDAEAGGDDPEDTIYWQDTADSTAAPPPPNDARLAEAPHLGKLPCLYPTYLPYETQHLILAVAQQVLEECCFDFATAVMPSTLEQHGWDCPVAVELTKWVKIFRRVRDEPPLSALTAKLQPGEVDALLVAVSQLRHTAVHRLPTTATGVSQFLKSAAQLAELLNDNLRASRLEELRCDVDGKIEAMELNKNVLEDRGSSALLDIRRRREELDRMEEELAERMLRDDQDNKALIGQLLKESVQGIFGKGKKKAGAAEDEEEEEDADEFLDALDELDVADGVSEAEQPESLVPNGVERLANGSSSS